MDFNVYFTVTSIIRSSFKEKKHSTDDLKLETIFILNVNMKSILIVPIGKASLEKQIFHSYGNVFIQVEELNIESYTAVKN